MSKPQEEKNVEIPTDILKELLTPSEVRMIKNRWQIINLLQDGLSIRSIAERVQVGTDTVVRVARMIEKGKLKKMLDEYKSTGTQSQTSWIFGKSDE